MVFQLISREEFKKATGYDPENDDLERCNCPEAGKIGHNSCGWCQIHNLPVFQCACEVIRSKEGTYITKNRFIL